jgi:hypothetical protein
MSLIQSRSPSFTIRHREIWVAMRRSGQRGTTRPGPNIRSSCVYTGWQVPDLLQSRHRRGTGVRRCDNRDGADLTR